MECCRSFNDFVDQDCDVLQIVVTGDESWCFQFDPEMKRQNTE